MTKTLQFDAIQSAYNNNINIIGENRVQEAVDKLDNQILSPNSELHLIGHLQSNKVNKAVKFFNVIQTVDSLKIAHKINNAASKINKVQRIYIQVNVGNDPNKHGLKTEEVLSIATEIHSLSNIHIEGVMMIPPFVDMDNHYRNIFKKTKELQIALYNAGIQNCLNISMGMSRDYDIAVEEGATHIRIGTALFGARE